MEDKIFVHGDCVVICPICGLQFPVSITDIINEREVMCPGGNFTAHSKEQHKNASVCDDDCKTSFNFHSFKLDKSKLVELNEALFEKESQL